MLSSSIDFIVAFHLHCNHTITRIGMSCSGQFNASYLRIYSKSDWLSIVVKTSDLKCHTVALTARHPVCSVFQQGEEGKVRLLSIPPTAEVTHQAGA